MELALLKSVYLNNKIKVNVNDTIEKNTINRIDLLEFNGTIIKTYNDVDFTNGCAELAATNVKSGNYLLRIRDPKGSDIIKMRV